MVRTNLKIEINARYRSDSIVLTPRQMRVIKHGEVIGGQYVILYTQTPKIGIYLFITRRRDTIEYRVALINGYLNSGPFYFSNLTVKLNNTKVFSVRGRHIIPTRLAWSRKFALQESALNYQVINDLLHHAPTWLRSKFQNENPYRVKFGIYEAWGHPARYTHGGDRVAPFHASWWTCPEGLTFASKWLDGTTDRCRIWCLDRDSGLPYKIGREYNLSRNVELDFPGFNVPGDGWCRYETAWTGELGHGGLSHTHDGEHMRRLFSEALVLKDYDPWAEFWLDAVYNDVSTAWNMDESVAALSPGWMDHGYCLWKRLQDTLHNTGARWVGREMAHAMILAARIGKDIPMWQNAVQLTANAGGILQGHGPESYYFPDARNEPANLTGIISQTFETMFLIQACKEIGETGISQRAANFIGTHPKQYFDINTGLQANTGVAGPNYFVPYYSVFTHQDLSEFNYYDTMSPEENIIRLAQERSLGEGPFDMMNPQQVGELIYD